MLNTWEVFCSAQIQTLLAQVAPSIGATYFLYSLLTKQWGIGGIRAYPHPHEAGPGAGSKPPISAAAQ